MKQAYSAESLTELITALTALHGISGREQAVGEFAAKALADYIPDAVFRDGSVTAHLGSDRQKPTLLICAHIDQVGFLVTDITDDGFLRIGAVGGIDRRLLLGQPVTVEGEETLSGVISILPPHLLQGEQAVPDDGQLCVDLGVSSAAALQGRVSRGDAVYYASGARPLQNDILTAPALDNRSGAAAVIAAASMLCELTDLPCNVVFCLSGQEERSGRGAKQAAFTERPDFAIAVDTTFAKQHDDSEECYVMGKGPAVGVSSVLSPELSQALTETAVRCGIPYQIEVMPEGTGTDADHLALAPGGCAAGTVSIPIRYMHTPVETVSIADVYETARLLAEYAKECGKA